MAPNFRGLAPNETLSDLPGDRTGTRDLVGYYYVFVNLMCVHVCAGMYICMYFKKFVVRVWHVHVKRICILMCVHAYTLACIYIGMTLPCRIRQKNFFLE